jgi:N-acetylneuraminic acid mutarotase
MKKIYSIIFAISIHYSLSAQNWQALPDVPVELAFPVVVELNGNIHVIGGGGPSGATDIHLRYSPSTNLWDTLAPVPYLAQQPAGAVVNGKIHFCGGGYPTTGQRLDLHYYYDPDSLQWYQAANMPVATAIHKAVSLDDKLYVLSGQPNRTLCEYYDPVNNSWTQRNPLPDQNFWYGAIVSTSNTIYRFGGGGYTAPSNLAHEYDKVNDTWISRPLIPEAAHAIAGTAINDSLICIGGGYAAGLPKAKVWIYNTNAQTYTLSDTFPAARDYHAMVLAGGCVYSVGGDNTAVPNIGVSLIKNCSLNIITSVSEETQQPAKPYSVINTPEQLVIRLNSSSSASAVKVIDISGRTILFETINDETISFGSRQFTPGVYLMFLAVDGAYYVEQWNVAR